MIGIAAEDDVCSFTSYQSVSAVAGVVIRLRRSRIQAVLGVYMTPGFAFLLLCSGIVVIGLFAGVCEFANE